MLIIMISGDDIRRAREAKGWSQAELASRVGISQPAIQKIERGGTAKSKFLREIIDILGLSDRADPVIAPTQLVPVRGVARAGLWQEYDDLGQDEFEQIPVIPGRWGHLSQFSYRVGGTSMVKANIFDGDYVVCVNYHEARTAMIDRDIVLVERIDGQKRETTVKRLRVNRETIQLVAESDDARFKDPLFVTRNGRLHEDGGVVVEIIGLVIGKYTPITSA